MKKFLLLAVVALATVTANAQTSQPTMNKAERKAAKAAKQPQVYKGSVAERRRVVTDAPGAEGDRDMASDDDSGTKSGKKMKSKN